MKRTPRKKEMRPYWGRNVTNGGEKDRKTYHYRSRRTDEKPSKTKDNKLISRGMKPDRDSKGEKRRGKGASHLVPMSQEKRKGRVNVDGTGSTQNSTSSLKKSGDRSAQNRK